MNTDYRNLISTLDPDAQQALEREIFLIGPNAYESTVGQLENLSFHQEYNPNSLRRLTVIFLKAVKENRLSIAQYASFSLVTTAIRDLTQDVKFFFGYHFKTSEGDVAITSFSKDRSDYGSLPFPTSYPIRELTANCVDPSITEPIQNPDLTPPMLKKFLYLDDDEWPNFLGKMESAPASEKSYVVITVPEFGHWSLILQKIRGVLKCFQDQEWLVKGTNNAFHRQKVFLIPSFSVLQAFVDVKGEMNKGRRITLIPTFGLLPPDKYAECKWKNQLPVGLFFPRAECKWKNQLPVGLFFPRSGFQRETRVDFDGYRDESWLAVALHDVYHGLRELQMNKTIFSIRERWHEIAKAHPHDKKIGQSRPISEILADGELNFSFPWSERSPFKNKDQNHGLQQLFKHLSASLHPDLKEEFIRDIADNEKEWRERFHFSLEDLGTKEQEIYRQVKKKRDVEQVMIPALPDLENPHHAFQALFNSLPRLEQIRLQEAFEGKTENTIRQTVQMLESKSYIMPRNPDPALFRERTENIFFALKKGRVNLSQVATFHLFESAKREVMENPSLFTYNEVLENGNKVERVHQLIPQTNNTLSAYFAIAEHDESYTNPSENGEKADPPIFFLKSFFHLNEEEWGEFISEIKARPTSEQSFLMLEVPGGGGVWSNSVRNMQKKLHCFQNQPFFLRQGSNQIKTEAFLVPSFSMFEIFLQIKSKKRGAPISLAPSFSILSLVVRSAMKADDIHDAPLYFPSSDPKLCCSREDPNYSIRRNGLVEGPFTYFLDHIYLALRETGISSEWNLARIRLASIIKLHSSQTYAQLTQIELEWGSYPDDETTVFKNKLGPQIFGDLFHERDVKESLPDSVKEMMIQDMVDHADEWKENFNLGKDDLREPEQKIYDQLKQEALIS